jgi:hypothetical protein
MIAVAVLMLAGCNMPANSQGKKIAEICQQKSSNVKICDCIGKKAVTELTEEEREALIALMSKEDGSAVMNLPVTMTMKAGQFVALATAACTAEAVQ